MTIGFAVLLDGSTQVLTDVAELRTIWPQKAHRVWVDLEAPSDETLREAGEIFQLDDESLSDCAYGEQRPRVDEFDDYIFLVLYGLYGLKEQEEIDPHKLAAFCGSNFLLTVHRHAMLTIRQVRSRCGRHPESLLNQGVDVVLYSIIDSMVDNYLRVADRYETHLEHLEDRSFDLDADQDEDVLSEASDVRGELLELRRLAVAQRQLLLPVAKGEYDFVSETLSQRFSHVSDHLSQVIDTVDSMRESIVSIRDNYHAALTRRTNEIMKVLTIYAGILLPLSLIAGIYGMNLRVWPSQNHPAGFWAVLGGMSVLAAVLFAFFRRRHWI